MTFIREMESKTSEELLSDYRHSKDHMIKQEIVMRYVPMVRVIALSMKEVYSGFAQTDDIVNEGVIALMKSIDKYDPEKNVKFDTYINKRIKGLIIDMARKQDWVPRSIRKSAKELSEAVNELYTELGRMPRDEEIAEHMNLTIEQYREKVSKSNFFGILSLEVITEENGEARKTAKLPADDIKNTPEHILISSEMDSELRKGIEVLREREKQVITMYYHKNLNMREIAEHLEISEPRVSQIHANALRKLRNEMNRFME